MTKPTVIFCDFDGTIFDPDLRAFKAPIYNRLSSKLMNRPDTAFIVTTGRYSWGPWTKLNYALTGMRRPDYVISGAGTFIYKVDGQTLITDQGWEKKMKAAFDKAAVQKKLAPFLKQVKLPEHRNPNPYLVIV
jgi:hydroxymethylpyrimidine pyrophosphatase-like HAD family hydrolase